MAAGTPVVAYDTFGARELVRPGADGILTEHTPEALASAICQLVASRDTLSRLSEAATRGAERFSLETTGRQMMAVYQQAIERMQRAR
jgi:glycosyltransferase involved in cell wall biosynthesis